MFWRKREKVSSFRYPRRRMLGIEQFEPRRLMAVTTAINSGTLTITGDAAGDDIAIVGTANPGEITVTGRNGTTINGTPNGSVTIPGVTADLVLALSDGNNVVDIDNVYVARDIAITGGADNDRITLGATSPVSPARNLNITTLNGGDLIRLGVDAYTVYVGGNCTVSGDRAGDNISAFGASAIGAFILSGGAEDDSVLAYGVTAGALNVTGSEGNNSVAVLTSSADTLYVTGILNRDTIYVDTVFARFFAQIGRTASAEEAHLVLDDLTITITRSIFGTLNVYGSGGDDTVYFSGNVGYRADLPISIGTGGGLDNIQLSYNSLATGLSIDAGNDDDDMSLVGNIATLDASANGGTGFNRLTLLGNQFATFTAINFQ